MADVNAAQGRPGMPKRLIICCDGTWMDSLGKKGCVPFHSELTQRMWLLGLSALTGSGFWRPLASRCQSQLQASAQPLHIYRNMETSQQVKWH